MYGGGQGHGSRQCGIHRSGKGPGGALSSAIPVVSAETVWHIGRAGQVWVMLGCDQACRGHGAGRSRPTPLGSPLLLLETSFCHTLVVPGGTSFCPPRVVGPIIGRAVLGGEVVTVGVPVCIPYLWAPVVNSTQINAPCRRTCRPFSLTLPIPPRGWNTGSSHSCRALELDASWWWHRKSLSGG